MRYVGGAARIAARYTSKPELAGWAKDRARRCGRELRMFAPRFRKESVQRYATTRLGQAYESGAPFQYGKGSACSNTLSKHKGIQRMKYLVPKNRDSHSKAHLWDEGDTFCKMFSTGGLAKKRYEVADDKEQREVCAMCRSVFAQFNPEAQVPA